MKIEKSTVTKLTITGARALDPIAVFLEDIAPSRGKIIIECYSKSWSSYWGGMGNRTIAQFFCQCDEHYIAKNLSDIKADIIDSDSIKEGCRKEIIADRRKRDLDRDEARDLYEELDAASIGDDGWCDPNLMQKILGDEWWYRLPTKPNPDYAYLCRIIKAVQEALQDVAEPTQRVAEPA
jgi:hypothetical protein